MLQGLLVKKVLEYVEKPNDLDKQIKVLQKKVDKYGKVIEGLEIAHTPINNLTDRLSKLENKARF